MDSRPEVLEGRLALRKGRQLNSNIPHPHPFSYLITTFFPRPGNLCPTPCISLPEHPIVEQQLIELCRQNDSTAQKVLYDHLADKVFGLCFRYMGNKAAAEDLVIESFLRAFKHLEFFEYRGPGSFEGWLMRIAVNQCLMALRKKTNFHLLSEDAAHEVSNEALAHTNLAVEEIMLCIQQLPDGYRTVFNLYAIEGFSHKEIAEQLNISEGTSKSQLSKARKMLQEKLKNIGISHGL